MVYHFYFSNLLSCVVNFENFQPAFVFSWLYWCGGVHPSLYFDSCGLCFVHQSQSEKWQNLWNMSTMQQTNKILLL